MQNDTNEIAPRREATLYAWKRDCGIMYMLTLVTISVEARLAMVLIKESRLALCSDGIMRFRK